MKFSKLIPLFLILLISACEESVETITFAGEAYYPLELGDVKVFEVDSILYYNGGKQDSIHSFIKEEIVDETIDAAGVAMYKIEVSTRRLVDDPWQITDVYSASKDEDGAYRTEENRRLQVLQFPLIKGRTWQPTLAFNENEFYTIPGGEMMQIYRYWENKVITLDSTVQINNTVFDDVVVVAMPDDTINKLERRYVQELYAKDIGLIASTREILEDQQRLDTAWHVKAQKGFIVRQQLIDF